MDAHHITTADELQWVTPNIKAPRLKQGIFDSAAAHTKVSYFIYTPEAYDKEPVHRFPVLYWLQGGTMQGVPFLVQHFDAAIKANKIPPMLIVFANGKFMSMWVNSKDGKTPMESVVIKDLVPHIDATYRTMTSRQARAVEGFSAGGYGAGRLGFKYSEIFGAVSMLSAGPLQQELKVGQSPRATRHEVENLMTRTYGNDQEYFKAQSPWATVEQYATKIRSSLLIRQVVGEQDEVYENNRKFDAHLTKLHIPHEFIVVPGVGHDTSAVLNGLGEKNWAFYRMAFANLATR